MSPQQTLPRIKAGQRAVIAGRSGSGKSTLANWLLENSPGVWTILNPKWTKAYEKLPNATTVRSFDPAKIDKAFRENRFVIINPSQAEASPEAMDAFVQWLHDNYEKVGLCVDELYTLHKNGKAGEGLLAWLTRGRELKQSFLGLTQRPAWISQFVFSESNFIGEMSLNLPADRKRMFEFIGNEKALENLPPRQWLWYDTENDKLRLFNPVPVRSDVK